MQLSKSGLSAPLRQVMVNAHGRWVELAGETPVSAPPAEPAPGLRRDLH